MRKIVVMMLVFLPAMMSFAGPASPYPVSITQPDGTRFQARIRGDEYQRWVETIDGYTILENRLNGTWEFAVRTKTGDLKTSGIAVRDQQMVPGFIQPGLRPARDVASEMRNARRIGLRKAGDWQPGLVTGPRNLLFIAVNFSDRQLVTDPNDWSAAIFDETPGNKTVANYYKANGQGLLQPRPAAHSGASDVVVVSINTKHPNTGLSNMGTSRLYNIETAWINDALEASRQFVDYNALDTNGDKDLTLDEAVIYFIVAGYDASGSTKEPNVWAHKWSTWNAGDVMAGDVEVNRWAINGELYDSGDRHAIGVITHELGHLMCYLPDLYDINNSNAGMGDFSLMASGSWGTAYTDAVPGATPTNMDAWCRYILGWDNPRQPAANTSVSFGLPLASNNSAVLLKDSSKSTDEYFLVENRYPTGWDLGLQPSMDQVNTTVMDGASQVPSLPMTFTPYGSVTGTAVACGLGNVGDFPAAVAGQIALIQRGDITYAEKVTNAWAAGATAAIIYNNTAGITNGTLGGPGNYVPAVGIDQADGPGLAGKTVSVSITLDAWNGGLLVQHIDVTVGDQNNNNINSSANAHQGITVVEANSSLGSLLDANNLSYGNRLHVYYAGNNTSFGPGTTPNSNYFNGTASGLGFSGVSAAGSSMTATITNSGTGGPSAPVAAFTYADNGLSVDFNDGSSDSDGSIVSWSWSFGDSSSSSAQNPTHVYSAAGSYTVTLTVTDNDGLSDSATQTVTVTDGSGGPTTDTFNGSIRGGATVDYSISVSGGVINASLAWGGSANMDLYLIAPGGATVASSAGSSKPESITYNTGGAAGVYTLRVARTGKGGPQSFTLTATYEN